MYKHPHDHQDHQEAPVDGADFTVSLRSQRTVTAEAVRLYHNRFQGCEVISFVQIKQIGVLRDTACATTTNQPTDRAPTEPAMDKNANFGPNLVVFGQKILFFTGEIKSFVTHITENPPRHLVQICFWSGIGQNVQKMAIFGPK